MNFETLPAMRKRHHLELVAAIEAERDKGITQTLAARNLDVSLQSLNNQIGRYGIEWKIKRQGSKRGSVA